MPRRRYSRRATLRALGLGAAGVAAVGTGGATASTPAMDGLRPDGRVQFVEADPDAGFNYPYWLATPASVRAAPVRLLVTMNSANPGQPFEGGGPDRPTTVRERARSQVASLDQVGAWVSERLGVPQLVPVFPMPDSTTRTTQLDRQSMLLEGTDLERVDRQLLRMTEHARSSVLDDRETHDRLLFWGNSSAGIAAEHMAVLHPAEIQAVAGAGLNGLVTLPLESLGDRTLPYPVGVGDLESVAGEPFDAAAFDAVDKFYLHGAHDTHDRLQFTWPGERPGTWGDDAVYETAKAVYGRDMVADRFPRCQIAFAKAGLRGQFRVYPEMTHDPEPSAPDVLAFFRASLAGEDVGRFGQRLTLPFDRTVELETADPSVGDDLQFRVSGDYPPPAGLVRYDWQADGAGSARGHTATFSFPKAGTYDVSLSMATVHEQSTQRGTTLATERSDFAAYRYDVASPRTELRVGQSLYLELDVTNVGSFGGGHDLDFLVDGERVDSRTVALDGGASRRIAFSTRRFEEPGSVEVHVPPAYRETVTVRPESTSTADRTPTTGRTPTRGDGSGSSGPVPGFGVLTALAGAGAAAGYLLRGDGSD